MNFVHIHLAINHSPLYAELFAFFLLLIGMLRRNRTLTTSALVVTIIAALCAIAADLTGDQAKDIIEHSPPIPGLEKTMIGPHDEAAGYVVISACVTAVLAIATLFVGRRRGERPRWMEVVVLLAIAFSLSIVARTALLGGRIHHPEIRAVAG